MVNPDPKLLKPISAAMTAGTLPGESDGFDDKAATEAAAFMLATAMERQPGKPNIQIESFADHEGKLAMRVAISNDDMPFLVDSTAAALAAANIGIIRLLHPVLDVARDENGVLQSVADKKGSTGKRESFIYLEAARVDAKERHALAERLASVLNDVRCAVIDWRKMQGAMAEDADGLPDGEGAALVRWFMDGSMTVLAHEQIALDGARQNRLGLSRSNDAALLSDESIERARKYFAEGGRAPLMLKSSRNSTVHRSVQLDIIVVGGLWL